MLPRLLRPISLRVQTSQRVCFVTPPEDDCFPAPPSAEDGAIAGTVTMSLPSARVVPALAVSLLRRGSTHDDVLNMTERWDRVVACVVLHESDAPLPAGTYCYAFSLPLPSTAAPSCANGLGYIECAA